jgi:glycolate oxidase iron-sulfur subunit
MQRHDGPEDRPTPHPAGDALREEEAGLLACVHCGFCLNACPTYTRLGHEGDSPRGRLDLMRAVAEGRLDPGDEAFRTHIDRCLGCRACEPVCPSGVPYGFLLERARVAVAATHGVGWPTRLLIATFTGPLRGAAGAAARLLRATGLARLGARALPRRWPLPRFGLAMLAASAPWPGLRRRPYGAVRRGAAAASAVLQEGHAPADGPGAPGSDVAPHPIRAFAEPHGLAGGWPEATGATEGTEGTEATGAAGGTGAAGDFASRERKPPRVAILRGCVQEALFARVNRATVRVLRENGCEVVEVPGQRCCGALDAHAGRLDRALSLARANIEAFQAAEVDLVVVNAAGCGAMMKEYPEQLRRDPAWREGAEALGGRVRDLAEFLLSRPLRRGAPVPVRVTFDAPCHLHHGQQLREAPLLLLDAIPGLERVPLRDADECCGGAGLYGVSHPELGGRILADKVSAVRESRAEVVCTPNPGCIMQIGAGLLLDGDATPVLHPVELLDESYRRAREAE